MAALNLSSLSITDTSANRQESAALLERAVVTRGGVIPNSEKGSQRWSRDLPQTEPEHFDDDVKYLVLEELKRILRSPILVQSVRLSRFLRLTVESTLKGQADQLKEYTIAIEAYGRRPDFDSCQDSIVRTEARRLRTKLRKYYQEEGASDPMVIEFLPGSYVPAFRVRQTLHNAAVEDRSDRNATEPVELTLTIAPFEHLACDVFAEACARGLTDEVIHRLTRMQGIRVFGHAAKQDAGQTNDRRHLACLAFEGIVQTEGQRIRVTSCLRSADGLHIASWRFEEQAETGQLFGTLERIAHQIVANVDDYRSLRPVR